MTDIVERLRNEVPCISDIGCANELCNEAAAEIERLRAALEKKDDLLNAWVEAYETGRHEPLVIAYEETARAALGGDA